ncbi:olfactory receptor 5AR1-like [Ahaetulla prasina]|uniref:olfactory receptor 5AR1-like n=1 Tax=Ahaetulla prasina TaxID=499056 RepID=UPI002649743A|nr:olfactory receptor 5AR1-like [Ahaetulla prasina]
MSWQNHTTINEFIFLGLTNQTELQLPLFVLFLNVYTVTLLENLGMIVLIRSHAQLQTPMYFFLSHLAFVDICYSSTITPKMLVNLLAERKTIRFSACVAQMFLFVIFGITECLLLAVMAYDRYVAICKPFHYPVIMCRKTCAWLVAGSYAVGLFHSFTHTVFTFTLTFCGSNKVNNYFCDIPPLLKLSCSDTHFYEMVIFALVSINCVTTTMTIFISYSCILIAVLRISSTESRHKAFSTCSSHMTVVAIFYGTIFFMYLRPTSTYTLDQDKVASLFYTVMIPMLNPMIYALRNQEVKRALQRMIRKSVFAKWKSRTIETL